MDHLTPHQDLYNVPWIAKSYNGMPYRRIGKTGLLASNTGLGTWKFGYPETGDGSRVGETEAMKIFDRAAELGVCFWDTANRYNGASGNAERLIGKWIQANANERRNIVIATKIFGGMDGKTPNHSRLSRINIIESVYASLERLQTDSIDLLYFHNNDTDDALLEESLLAIEDLVKDDLIRYFAVSNHNVKDLKKLRKAQKKHTVRSRIAAVQNKFDILNGEEKEFKKTFDYCQKHGISYVAYSPLARGILTGRYLNGNNATAGNRLFDEGTLEKDLKKYNQKKIRKLAEIAQKHEMTLSELTLSYMLTLPSMGPVIPSVSNTKQLESAAKAGKETLSDELKTSLKEILQ